MIAVIFEVEPADGRKQDYLDIAAEMRPMLDDVEGRVRRLVAIATPFSGSVLARLVPSRPVRAMRFSTSRLRSSRLDSVLDSLLRARFAERSPCLKPGSGS